MPLSSHFLKEDLPQVLEEIKHISTSGMKAFDVVENGQFEMKDAILAEMQTAFTNLEMLNRKKIDADLTEKAEEIRRHYY